MSPHKKRRNATPLGLGEEAPDPNEEKVFSDLLQFLKDFVDRQYPTGQVKRDVQTKHHGCVRAQFIVEELPTDLAVGLFAKPHTYEAWIRFANQEPKPPKDDYKKDFRGMSIKVLGVPGDKILEEEKTATTQDFLMINAPVFVTKDTEGFLRLRQATEPLSIPKFLWFIVNPLDNQFRALKNILTGRARMASPLELQYFSTTPIKFGPTAAKYSAKPRSSVKGKIPKIRTSEYLRVAMREQLRHEDVSFDFMVQLQTDPVAMPVEDAGKVWSEQLSPFRKVATVRIPKQDFDTPAQQEYCEDLALTPWHSLPEHRPLGGVNRARRLIYQVMSQRRRERNGVPVAEPTGTEAKLPDTYTNR